MYTPEPLANFVAEQAIAALRPSSSGFRVLDPACGNGALLAAAAHKLPEESRVELVGYDLDGAAVNEARSRLVDLGGSRTVIIDKVDFIDAILEEQESLRGLFSADDPRMLRRFDLVIANPPYVRTQVLGAQKAQRLAVDFGLTGRVDLYHAFAVAMAATLKDDGVLALLCSNRFLTTKTGVSLRDAFRKTFEIVSIFDLGDSKAFDAAVLPAVVIARRRDSGTSSFPMVSVYETVQTSTVSCQAESVFEPLLDGTEGVVDVGGRFFEVRRGDVVVDDIRKPWVPASRVNDWIAQLDASAAMRFGDIGKIRVGVKTTADSVFIRQDWLSQIHSPEVDLLLPLLTHHVAAKWTASAPTRQILYPYDLDSEKRTPVPLAIWPNTEAYLEDHRAQLEGRSYVTAGGRFWWEIWVPQRPSTWKYPKVVFPDISDVPRFFYDRTGAVVNGDCYWVTVDDPSIAFLMMAVANSNLGREYYDAVCGNRLYAGRRRYITQYVERFPLPDPGSSGAQRAIDIVGELVTNEDPARTAVLEKDLDLAVRESFGIK